MKELEAWLKEQWDSRNKDNSRYKDGYIQCVCDVSEILSKIKGKGANDENKR